MKKTILAAAALSLTMLGIAPLAVVPAEAAMISKRVVSHFGPMGHGCRKVIKTYRSHGRMVRTVRRVCR